MTTRFVDEGGSTELIVSMEISPAGVLRFVAPLMKGWLVRELKKDYGDSNRQWPPSPR